MMDLLKFIFRDFWTFAGCVVLIYIPCQTLILVSYNIWLAVTARGKQQ